MKPALYFIALIPTDEIIAQVTAIKSDFADRFKSKHSLKVIPHITLKAPFNSPAPGHDHLMNWFQQMPISVKPFQQVLQNFDCFAKKRNPVIFIRPVINEPLITLQKEIIGHFQKSFLSSAVSNTEVQFSPHMTVAYRDLQPAHFREAWEEYKLKNFEASFIADKFYLLQHDGIKWNTINERILK
jgi:2'-5' RNA ligase